MKPFTVIHRRPVEPQQQNPVPNAPEVVGSCCIALGELENTPQRETRGLNLGVDRINYSVNEIVAWLY